MEGSNAILSGAGLGEEFCWAGLRKGGAGKHEVALVQDPFLLCMKVCVKERERGVHTLACPKNSMLLLEIHDECSVVFSSVRQLS